MPRMPTTTAAAISATVPLGSAVDRVGDPAERPPRVDAADPASVSFPPHGGAARDARPSAGPADEGHERHAGIAVGPGAVGPGSVGPGASARGQYRRSPGILDVSGLPVHGAKIHCPLLPATTLSRERLNGWLDEHAGGRIVVIVAEAGFGKTTLLADWSRRTQRRCLWYRLEPDDRDWLGFVRHVVASGRELDDTFMPRTLRLLSDMGPGGPTRDTVVDSFVAELASEAGTDPNGITLILDDYHAIDGNEETTPIVRRLLEQSGDGLSLVVSTRSKPALPLGRLRARGGVARLEGEDLCFERDETDRLFRDAYGRPLEPDVVEDLVDRTDGWPAALHLVRTAIDDRTPHEARTFIRELSGARGELHDFLAEEVVGSLPMELQQFLMRTAILEAVDPRAVPVVDPPSAGHVPERVARAETLGLLARPDFESPHRFHPLVRDFLQARLLADVGADRVREMHLEVGRHFEGVDWRISATHYARGGDQTSVDRVVDDALDQILGEGSFTEADTFVASAESAEARLTALILRSRAELSRGEIGRALTLAERAANSARGTGDPREGVALLNLASLLALGGPQPAAIEAVSEALSRDLTPSQRDVGQALLALWEAAHEGDLEVIARLLRRLGDRQIAARQFHYAAVTRLNTALVLFWRGDAAQSLRAANEAEALFLSSSRGTELGAVAAARARALAHLNRMGDARTALEEASRDDNEVRRYELLVEGALVHCLYGAIEEAEAWLEAAGPPDLHTSMLLGPWAIASAELAVRKADFASAKRALEQLRSHGLGADASTLLRTRLVEARVAIASGEDAKAPVVEAGRIAEAQRSRLGRAISGLLTATLQSGPIGGAITGMRPSDLPALSMVAEELSANLHRLVPEALAIIQAEAQRRPERWRSALCGAVERQVASAQLAAAELVRIGTRAELERVRAAAVRNRSLRTYAVDLARRLAPRIQVHDLGPVSIEIGDSHLAGHRVRRRVLALVCFLLSRPSMAASRDEVLDQLWPDLSPETSINSLNQTIYFLRRVFEPDYREGFSAGYVRFDGETISFDRDLVTCASQRCRELVAQARRGDASAASRLAEQYAGRFALDFAYEEWAAGHRDRLHAAVLGVLESAIEAHCASGQMDAAIELAQRALELEPTSDEIERTLLRLYRATGQQTAAAEQYAHYAAMLRDDLGVEPPPLEAV